jgi:hypothetical protein
VANSYRWIPFRYGLLIQALHFRSNGQERVKKKLTGERDFLARDTQEAVNGGAPVVCDGGGAEDEVWTWAASSYV